MSLDGKVAIIDIDGRFGAAMLALGRYSGGAPHLGDRMSIDPDAVHGADHRAIASRRIAYATVAKIGRPVLVLVERATPRQAGRSADPAVAAVAAAHACIHVALPGDGRDDVMRSPAVAALGAWTPAAGVDMAANAATLMPGWDDALVDVAGTSLLRRTRAPWVAIRTYDRASTEPAILPHLCDLAVSVACAAFALHRDGASRRDAI